MSDREYIRLSERDHFYMNPERDLGIVIPQLCTRYLMDFNAGRFQSVSLPYVEGLERILLEILYNAGDNCERSRAHSIEPGVIRVWMTPDTFRVWNEGRPISCKFDDKEGMYIPAMIFGHLLTGSSFNNDSRKTGGKYGIGCKAANIMSLMFHVEIGNGAEGVKYEQKWTSNMGSVTEPKITPYSGKSYTQITLSPDFARFYNEDLEFGFQGKKEFPRGMGSAMAKHCADVSVTANVPVYFNDKLIDCTGDNGLGLLKYARYYFPSVNLNGAHSSQHILYQSKDSLCLFIDTPDSGNTISFVNGVINMEHGVHVDVWRKKAFKPILDYLSKFKAKEKDVAEHISMILMCRLTKVKYKAQTKDRVAAPKPEVSFLTPDGEVHPNVMLKWEGVKNLEKFLKAKQNALAKKTDGSKKKSVNVPKLSDAREAGGPNSMNCELLLTEGDSAKQFGVKGVGNGEYTGVMSIRGKLLNVGTCKVEQYTQEDGVIAMLKKAIGLREGMDYETDINMQTLRYGKSLIILSDQDPDGQHIRGLVLNFFRLKFPSLMKRGYVKIMETPYVRVLYKSKTYQFFYQREYEEWLLEGTDQEKASKAQCVPKYYKGLSSSSDKELAECFRDAKIITPIWDDKAEELMSIAFDEGYEDERKEWLLSWDPIKCEGKYSEQFHPSTISYFVTNQLCGFSWVNMSRSIPGLDGLKECQRKVLAVVLKLRKEMKVSQLKGRVSEKMHYRYGDDALYRTIVGMGNYCVGTNNVPLIKAGGQYDSREGKKAGKDRYIYASASPLLSYLFRKEDECILEYKYEGKDQIEPVCYYPILPLFAVNGVCGIGTGFSTDIPAHNPVDVMKYIVWWLKVRTGTVSSIEGDEKYQAPPVLAPWYRNYKGDIVKIGQDWYSIGRYQEIKSRKRVKDILITEIPVTQTIDSYLTRLEEMMKMPITKNWTGEGKCPTQISGYKSVPKNVMYKYKGEEFIEVVPNIDVYDPLCIQNSESPLRVLGLIEKISASNIVLLGPNNQPYQFAKDKSSSRTSVMKAIDTYCAFRYDGYVKRRELMINHWKDIIRKLELRKNFILDVVNKRVKFRDENKKTKSESTLASEIEALGYPREFLRIGISLLTLDGIASIDKEIASFQVKIDEYSKKSPAQLWITELQQLFEKL